VKLQQENPEQGRILRSFNAQPPFPDSILDRFAGGGIRVRGQLVGNCMVADYAGTNFTVAFGAAPSRQRRSSVMISTNAELTGSYDYLQVALSGLIAVSASYAALDLGGRVTATSGWLRLVWLTGGAAVMGFGIWSMHFVGMLAFSLPVPVSYNWPTVVVALLTAILSSAFALYVVSRHKMGLVRAFTGSVIMGTGIAASHYIGINAMRLAAVCRFDLRILTLSVVLAIVFSLAALVLAFDQREETRTTPSRKILSAIVLGAAISAMHYTGMASASFIASAVAPDVSHAVSISSLGTIGIAIVTLTVLGLAILTCKAARRFAAQAEELERRVIERTRQLTTINEELRKEIVDRQRAEDALQEAQAGLAHATRVLAMGELVTSIAHEVNQPLTAIVTNGNFALRQLASRTPNLQEVREAIAEIVNDGTRASEVISRIRALLKKGAPDRVELDINEVIKEVTKLVRYEATRSHVSVRLDLAADLPRVLGDRVQLQQVLINLIINSIEAVRILTDRPRELLIKSAKNADAVLIQVWDSGNGFDPEQADRIFEPFFTTKPQGIGMGLSISRSIIESDGGRLWTVPGTSGTLFQFILPTNGNTAA
jgi:two-component system sensor histidine kinase/response regulator